MADQKPCDLCSKAFAGRQSLSSHRQTHSGYKKHNCAQCNKSFRKSSNLKTHSRIHTGEKPHKCTQCNYSCTQVANLREHIMKHTGEKPHQCNQCDFLQLGQAIWRSTKGVTLGKSLTNAQCASIPVSQLVICSFFGRLCSLMRNGKRRIEYIEI